MTDTIHIGLTEHEPVAWMYEHRTSTDEDGISWFAQPNRANMDPRYWQETPLYTAPQGSEREAIVAWLTQRVGVVVRMILMAGMPGVSRTQKVKDKAFADGYGKAIADLKNAIARGDHLPPPPANGGE